MDDRSVMSGKLREMAAAAANLGSPLYEKLLTFAADDVDRSGPTWEVMRTTVDLPPGSARALRLMGAVHRMVIDGEAPALAAFYPSVGGRPGPGVVDAFATVVEENVERLRDLVTRPVQTNEVGRCAALVGGFLTVAQETGLPLRIFEVGASAGLNLRWDRFFYEARGVTWGDPASSVHLCSYNSDRPPPFDVTARVIERAGCDPRPVDPTTQEGRLTLMSLMWPDQPDRLRLLRNALEVAQSFPAPVETAPAGTWTERVLADRAPGTATVVFHSIVMQYVPDDERERFERAVSAAGDRATADAPIAWLRMEPAGDVAHVHLTTWPGGNERLVAISGYHGRAVRWLL